MVSSAKGVREKRMGGLRTGAIIIDRLARRMWCRLARQAGTMPLARLAVWQKRADALAGTLAEFRSAARERLHRSRTGTDTFHKPPRTDWAWRPPLWSRPVSPSGIAGVRTGTTLGPAVSLHHDAILSAITFHQERNNRPEDLAPHAASIDILDFDGSYLSLSISGPQEGRDGLDHNHILRLEILLDLEEPIEIFTRLNLRHGPNVSQIVQDFDGRKGKIASEFDLGTIDFEPELLDHFWVDVIFESPAFNRIRLGDMALLRYPRAKL